MRALSECWGTEVRSALAEHAKRVVILTGKSARAGSMAQDSRELAFSMEIQQARRKDREVKTKSERGSGHCLNRCIIRKRKRLSSHTRSLYSSVTPPWVNPCEAVMH